MQSVDEIGEVSGVWNSNFKFKSLYFENYKLSIRNAAYRKWNVMCKTAVLDQFTEQCSYEVRSTNNVYSKFEIRKQSEPFNW